MKIVVRSSSKNKPDVESLGMANSGRMSEGGFLVLVVISCNGYIVWRF